MTPPILSRYDHERLQAWRHHAPPATAALVTEFLRRALVLSPHARLPCGTIALGSTCDLQDPAAGTWRRVRVVAPDDPAGDLEDAVSVFHPLGLALLGRAEGDRLPPTDESGARWRIVRVPRQPVAVAAATL